MSTGDTTALNAKNSARFAAAYQAIANGVSPVAAVSIAGFDTHSDSQVSACTNLSTWIAVLMDQLTASQDLANTTIAVVSDFDRTRSFNASGGTDHSIYGSVALFGNGIQSQTVADGTSRGTYPGSISSIYRRRDVWATIFDIFGISSSSYLPDANIIGGIRA